MKLARYSDQEDNTEPPEVHSLECMQIVNTNKRASAEESCS